MIRTYSLEDKENWIKIVETFKNNDVYYYPEYVDAYKKNGDGEPILIHFKNETFEAINVVIKRDLSMIESLKGRIQIGSLFDFTTPYGYGGILFNKRCSSNEKLVFFNEYFEFCKQSSIVTEFVRFNPILKNHMSLQKFIPLIHLGSTISIETVNLKQIWENFSSKNRNTIRKSLKNGVEVFWGNSKELQKIFVKMYIETMNKDNADSYYYFSDQYFESLFTEMKYKMKFFYAVYQEKIVSISIILFHRKKIHYHLSASDVEYRNVAPTNMLLFELSKYAYINGYDEIHLGGGLGGKTDGLYNFKKSFNRNKDNSYVVGKLIFNSELYGELIKGIEMDSYFPLYRKG